MYINRAAKKTLWVAGILVVIGAAVFLAWQLRLAHLRALTDRSLLTDIPCSAPCWQGIIPGETSQSEAMQILRNSTYIRQDSLQETGTRDMGGVTWWWLVSCHWLQPKMWWQDGIVQEITLGLTYDLTVEQVVAKFGPPDAIEASVGSLPDYPEYYLVDLYYPSQGVQFKAYTVEGESSLGPSTEVGAAVYFVPTSLDKRAVRMELTRLWKGYGDLFEVYYDRSELW